MIDYESKYKHKDQVWYIAVDANYNLYPKKGCIDDIDYGSNEKYFIDGGEKWYRE